MPELVSLTDAAAIVKKPRHGAAIYAFKRTAWKAPQQPDAASEAPPSKCQRTAQPEEQGRFIHYKKKCLNPCTQLMVICFRCCLPYIPSGLPHPSS